MTFNIPTTENGLNELLLDIGDHYLMRVDQYVAPEFEELDLDGITYTAKTAQQIAAAAADALEYSFARDVAERTAEINAEITALTAKKAALNAALVVQKGKINDVYGANIDKVNAAAAKQGTFRSNVTLDQITFLEAEKAAALLAADEANDDKIAEIDARLDALEDSLAVVDTYFSDKHAHELAEKIALLTKEEDEKVREIFKYNNQISEKVQKYSNMIQEKNTNLRLKYLEIMAAETTDSELFIRGYFNDVLRAVRGYYFTLAPSAALTAFMNNDNMPLYLRSYYTNVLYLFQSRAA